MPVQIQELSPLKIDISTEDWDKWAPRITRVAAMNTDRSQIKDEFAILTPAGMILQRIQDKSHDLVVYRATNGAKSSIEARPEV